MDLYACELLESDVRLHAQSPSTWTMRRERCDTINTLSLVQQLLDKIAEYREAFLQNYADIGSSLQGAARLAQEHKSFTRRCMPLYERIEQMLTMATRLIDGHHYSSQSIRVLSGKLDAEWHAFLAALEGRAVVLQLSVEFHQRAEMVMHDRLLKRKRAIVTFAFSLSLNTVPEFGSGLDEPMHIRD